MCLSSLLSMVLKLCNVEFMFVMGVLFSDSMWHFVSCVKASQLALLLLVCVDLYPAVVWRVCVVMMMGR